MPKCTQKCQQIFFQALDGQLIACTVSERPQCCEPSNYEIHVGPNPYRLLSQDKGRCKDNRQARYVCNSFNSRTPGHVTKMNDKHDRCLGVSESCTRGPANYFQERISDATYSNSFSRRTLRDWNKGSLTVWALYAYFSDSRHAAFGLLVWCM